MGDTTNIFELPSDPVGGASGSGSNISFSAQDTAPSSVDQTTINQIVNGLQQASHAGMTQLRSRDIPMNTENLTNDPQVQANYIPNSTANVEDYIDDDCDINHPIPKASSDRLDKIYDEVQMPLLISILYFCFQLPICKRMLLRFIPFLFSNDGNINLYGYFFMSILFGVIYYLLSKVIVI